MKELYIAPEVKLIGFVASEKIAGIEEEVTFGQGITLGGGYSSIRDGDVYIPLT